MKILLYIGAISVINKAGGAKRVFCEMANALTVRGHEVYAVCNDFHSGHPFYPLDERVRFINLDGSGHRKIKPLTWVKSVRPFLPSICEEMIVQYIEEPLNRKRGEPLVKLIQEVQPDVVIPYFASDYFSMLRQPMLDVPVILMHHNNVGVFLEAINTRERIASINTCCNLQVLQQSFVPEIQKVYHGTIHVIPNVVPQIGKEDMVDLTVEKSQQTITQVSRVSTGKQQHLLIQAFSRLAKDYTDWNVEIYGPLKESGYPRKLKKMITSLGLSDRIKLMGTTDRPLEVLRQADIFAFPSNYPEGFALALTEAMAVGLPCVGLKSTPSVNELIVDGVNGFLAGNSPEDFAEKLKILMDDQNLRVKMGTVGHEMMAQYAPEVIWEQWEKLIEKIVQEHQ